MKRRMAKEAWIKLENKSPIWTEVNKHVKASES